MKMSIIYWRDIPSQVVAKAGRKASKTLLPDRFQEAIDRAAMRSKAHDSDAYLQGWRKSDPLTVTGDGAQAAADKSAELAAAFTDDLLEKFVKNDGWEPDQ